jgi:prepilin-type N-terminal cleavage/methylation domain-containing protein
MALANINTLKKNRGFTIVELLIVIVVIAILATISIVAYTGIQNRAKTSAGQTLASQVAKKLEAYYAINSAYPTTKTQIQGTNESKIDGLPAALVADTDGPVLVPNTDTIFNATVTATTSNSGQAVSITGTAAGGNVYYWDFSIATPAAVAIKYGP